MTSTFVGDDFSFQIAYDESTRNYMKGITMAKHILFKDVKIGDFFYLSENGEDFDYKKISETEASIIVGDIMGQYEVVTDFDPEYCVGYYAPSYDSAPEFPNYYDAQGHEHAEF